MEVNFDNLRLKAAKSYNRLVKELNRHVDGENILDHGIDTNDTFVVGDIYDEMNDIRNVIGALLCIEDEKFGIKSIDIDLDVFAPEE